MNEISDPHHGESSKSVSHSGETVSQLASIDSGFFLLPIVFGLLGVIVSAYTTYHHLQVKVLGVTDAFCNISDTISCDRIAQSVYSEFMGIPVGAWGLGYFVACLGVLWASRSGKSARNHLHTYMVANLAMNNKQSEVAKKIILARNRSDDYLKVSIWDFEMGFTKLYHLETQESARYLESFLNSFKGKFYVKDACQKLSWCYYLQGNMAAAEEARKKILLKGATDSDADKQALKDAKSGKWPNILLLKSRLLSDGGYATDAAALLQGKTENDFSKEEEKLEFAYRMARIYDDLGRDEEAIQYYLTAIRLGENRKEYFAARAALQTGQLYERKGQKTLAINYYQKCLDMDDHEYKNSLDQRAKSGIARCKGE